METFTPRRPFRVIAVLTAVVAAVGCATTINHVLADPSRYRDHDVKLSGSVVDSFSIADNGAYRLKDDTGEIWVVSQHGVPRTGAKVTVEGTIREGFNLGSLGSKLPAGAGSGLVLVEASHSAK